MSHTPGPWNAEPTEPNSGFNCWTVVAASGEDLAWTKGYQDDAEKAANARLMAAAPDLLAALKEILPWHDSHPAEATDNRIINLCRAAIARVEGATP